MQMNAAIAVNRFGLGGTPADLSAAIDNPKEWLLRQLKAQPPHPALANLPSTSAALKEFPKYVAKLGLGRQSKADSNMAGAPMASGSANNAQPKGVEALFREHFGPILGREYGARLASAVETPAPFHERLVWFWSNHFTVSTSKPVIAAVVGPFEREAIRPNVTGKFVDLLLAAVFHPAMIQYLDNNLSIAPGSARPATGLLARANLPRPTGLNENLAREILELHTLGVGGGYSQTDVTTFARALTGWTVGGLINTGTRFDGKHHDHGTRTVLGKLYTTTGEKQAETILRDLVAHPSTATFIATKLARHFISDDPPPAAVARLAAVFRETDGDLAKVYAALVESPEAWARPLTKAKQPNELVVSTFRMLNTRARGLPYDVAIKALASMGQTALSAPSPKGWPDTGDAWLGPDGLWKRIEWANTMAQRHGNSIDAPSLAKATYGETLGDTTLRTLERAESREQALALWLASPEFQRR